MTSPRVKARLGPSGFRWRARHVLTGLLVVGCGLLVIDAVLALIVDRPSSTSVAETAAPNIEVRGRFSMLAPDGQTTGFSVATDGSLAVGR